MPIDRTKHQVTVPVADYREYNQALEDKELFKKAVEISFEFFAGKLRGDILPMEFEKLRERFRDSGLQVAYFNDHGNISIKTIERK